VCRHSNVSWDEISDVMRALPVAGSGAQGSKQLEDVAAKLIADAGGRLASAAYILSRVHGVPVEVFLSQIISGKTTDLHGACLGYLREAKLISRAS
jgi:hypothetical protein